MVKQIFGPKIAVLAISGASKPSFSKNKVVLSYEVYFFAIFCCCSIVYPILVSLTGRKPQFQAIKWHKMCRRILVAKFDPKNGTRLF